MEAVQLNLCAWFLEEEKKTEACINQMRRILGTFITDRDHTFGFIEGYLAGIKTMYREYENLPVAVEA